MTLIDLTLSNARRFYSSMGNPLAVKGLRTMLDRAKRFLSTPNAFFPRMYQLEKDIFENIYPENLIDWTMHNFQQPPDPNHSPSGSPIGQSLMDHYPV